MQRSGLVWSFSALQRAENSSIASHYEPPPRPHRVSVLFSEPKIPQLHTTGAVTTGVVTFSALQRAENSSIRRCVAPGVRAPNAFSALQRAENSSIQCRER